MSKAVYQTDEDGLFLSVTEARESPLEPGVFLIPARCVEEAPPEIATRQVAKWQDGEWIVLADHRGETWYRDGDPVVIDFVGDPAGSGFTQTAPEPSLSDLRSAKIKAIEDAAEALLAAGAPVADSQHVALDTDSRADLTAMAATATAAAGGAVSWPDSYSRGWISIENTRIPLATPAAGLTLAASVGDHYAAIVQHRRDLKDAALAAGDSAALDAIDVTTGWPE